MQYLVFILLCGNKLNFDVVLISDPVYSVPLPLPMVTPQDSIAIPGENVVLECLVGGL